MSASEEREGESGNKLPVIQHRSQNTSRSHSSYRQILRERNARRRISSMGGVKLATDNGGDNWQNVAQCAR